MTDPEAIRSAVKARYRAAAAPAAGCASPSAAPATSASLASDTQTTTVTDGACCGAPTRDPITSDLYSLDEVGDLPSAAILASLGCGNPTALAELRPGEVVLDLGSGGGIDVLLSARRVGPTGFVYGVDMTDEMLALAERNAADRGVTHVRFLKGEIEHLPLPDASVDVVISNCVINLSVDKAQVLREAFRVLRPGGRLAVSDVVVQGSLPDALRRDLELWAGCVAGALEEDTYRRLLRQAGFLDVGVEVTRAYDDERLASFDGRLVSAFVRARRPG